VFCLCSQIIIALPALNSEAICGRVVGGTNYRLSYDVISIAYSL